MKYKLCYRIARKTSDIGGMVSIFTELADSDKVFDRIQEIMNEHDENTCGGQVGGLPKKAKFFPLKKFEFNYSI